MLCVNIKNILKITINEYLIDKKKGVSLWKRRDPEKNKKNSRYRLKDLYYLVLFQALDISLERIDTTAYRRISRYNVSKSFY
jgi:hypothetical protein